MADQKLDDLTQRSLHLGILSPPQLQEIWTTLGTQNIDTETFLQETVRKGFLTGYQVDRLASGESGGFFFGEYKVLYHVGAGTFARVYRASHKDSGKIVAVKALRSRFNDDQVVINHFVHEAELGIELRHPNIVPIFEVKSQPNEHFMVMDFIEGQTLREFLRIRTKIEPKLATRIVMDICSGLDYASRRGLQHRDLKLSNVLLSSLQKAMLVDFGLATIAENVEFGNAEVRNQRSIDYAALERITGVKRDDKRSDIYFLGCIYYHLLCGEPPLYETKDRTKRLDKNRFTNVKPIQNIDSLIPRAVTLVVNKAMSLDVSKRYQSMGEMYTDLEICARRLAEGTANDGISPMQIDTGLARMVLSVPKEKQRAVMIVDSDTKLQEVFRESLKKAGFRVLVATSAERAVDRLHDDISVTDIVIFNGQSLGPVGVEAFNRLASDPYSEKLPSIIMLDERQEELANQLIKADHRIALTMPITMKIIKDNIARLIEPGYSASGGSASVPLVEIPVDVLSTLAPVPETEETGEHAVSDYVADEPQLPADSAANDAEDDDGDDEEETTATKKSVGYKEILAEQADELDSGEDDLYDANVPKVISKRAGGEQAEQEPEEKGRGGEVAEPEPEAAKEPLTLEELQDAVSRTRLRFGEAIRAEEEINKRLREFTKRKAEVEETAQKTRESFQEAQANVDAAFNILAETTIAVDSVTTIESESKQLLEEASRSKEDAHAIYLAVQEKAGMSEEEVRRLTEQHEQTQQKLESASTASERAGGVKSQIDELESNFGKLSETLEQVKLVSENALTVAGEARGIADETANKLSELTAEHTQTQEHIQNAATEKETAITIAEEAKQTAENLAQEADAAMQAAVEKATLAEELEEEARKAVERAELARKEANEAMDLASETQVKAEHAAEESRSAQQFIEESEQRAESAASRFEELRGLLESLQEEHRCLNQEAEAKEEAAVQSALEHEQTQTEWETVKKMLDESQEEHARLLLEKGSISELYVTVEQIATEKDNAHQTAQTVAEEVEREKLHWEETEKYEEECRLQLEKVYEEASQLKEESEEASHAAEQAQKTLDEALEKQRKAESELREIQEQEAELNRLVQERAAAKESARNAADAAQKALTDFAGTTGTSLGMVPPSIDSDEQEQSPGTGTGRHTLASGGTGSVGDRVAAAIRARVEAALAERKKKEENK